MLTLSFLCVFAFAAGLIDAAVGGGGLIQIPALFNLMPQTPAASLFGTNKLSSACGTTLAVRSYMGRVPIQWSLVLPAAISAFVMSFAGAAAVSSVPQGILRPMVLVLIILMAIYTFIKKDFGTLSRPQAIGRKERILALLIGGAIGFYDGLFGPGTGSFLIFLFIRFFGFNFLEASASSKLVNLGTNLAALLYFVPTHNVIYTIALPMAASNMTGAFVGSHIAMKYGTRLIRILFLIILVILIAKLGYDLFFPA